MFAELIIKIAEMEAATGETSKWWPRCSSAGPERCLRQQVYQALQISPKPLPGRAAVTFDDGNWHEELTKNWLRRSAYKIHSEQMQVKVQRPGKDWFIAGRIDWLMTDPAGIDWLVEHKSINSYGWDRLARGGDMPRDNITQTCLYLRGLLEVAKISPRAILLYKNKNTSAYLELWVDYDPEMDKAVVTLGAVTSDPKREPDVIGQVERVVEAAVERFQAVLDCAEKKELPARDYQFDHWRCSYCAWAGTCWEGYAAELKREDVPLAPEDAAQAMEYERLRQARLDAEKAEKAAKLRLTSRMHELEARSGEDEAIRAEVEVAVKDGIPVRESVKVKKRKEKIG